MTTATDHRETLRENRAQYAPEWNDYGRNLRPEPLVVIPSALLPKTAKGKRCAETYAAYLDAIAHEERSEDALDQAESEFRTRDEWRARRDEMADRLARGEVAPDAVEALLPTFSEADHLARCETLAVALGTARRNYRTAVRDYDAAAADVALDVVAVAVAVADRLESEAVALEAVASAARAKVGPAREVATDLRLPEAFAAVKAAGIGTSQGITPLDRARGLVSRGLVSPLEGWSPDVSRYTHPDMVKAATALGLNLARPTVTAEDVARIEAETRIRAARGDFADGTSRTWSAP